MKVKVCDFGLAKQLSMFSSTAMSANVYGTPGFGSFNISLNYVAYQAPELSSRHHNHKVDVYSFAIMYHEYVSYLTNHRLWELASRQLPWSHVDNGALDVISRAVKGERLPLSTANPFRDIIMKCWDADPNKRPEFSGRKFSFIS